MITRSLVRTRTIQTLFAYYQCGDKTPSTARKELLRSFSDTYSLYMALLDFVNELTTYAQDQIFETSQRARFTHKEYVPNRRFVDNLFAKQLFENRMLRHYLDEQHLSWEVGRSAVEAIYNQLITMPFYQDYLQAEETGYEADKAVWRKIFSELLPNNAELLAGLEEMEIALDMQNWATDLNYVLSFAVKTVRRFREENGADQELLQLFDKEDELQFAKDLLDRTIEHRDECLALIHAHLKNWTADRLAFMDVIILQTALTEIMYFPEIALEVSLNEYIELAKDYSGDKSYIFINGILNEILHDLKRENKLLKALAIK